LVEARERLAAALTRAPDVRGVLPSAANFVVVRCADPDRLYQRLLSVGIVVRNVSRHPGMTDCLRISVGSESDHRRLFAALGVREAAA
jgi:histidinol-phosphate aminotransferase